MSNEVGYDSLTGLNSGDLGFQSLQGYVNGKKYYAPVPYNPAGDTGVNAPGYIDFGENFTPELGSPGQYDYFYYGNYGEALAAVNPGGKPISYGSAPTNSLDPGQGNPTINGIDYTQGAAYANQASQGIGTANPNSPNGIDQFNQYTEPGYKTTQYSQAALTGTQSYGQEGQIAAPSGNQATFLFGNNGSAGSVSGTMSNTTLGQSTQFYQNPALQALTQSRSQN